VKNRHTSFRNAYII